MKPDITRADLVKIVKILDKAISMEKNAQAFYRTAADFTKDPEGIKMFQWLSRFEEGHVLKLTNRRKEILAHPRMVGIELPDPEGSNLSETRDLKEINKMVDDIEVLKIALQNERRAYSFYQKKVTASDDETTRQMFETFVKEEGKHIKILDDQLHSLKMNKIYKDFEDFGSLM